MAPDGCMLQRMGPEAVKGFASALPPLLRCTPNRCVRDLTGVPLYQQRPFLYHEVH